MRWIDFVRPAKEDSSFGVPAFLVSFCRPLFFFAERTVFQLSQTMKLEMLQ